MWLRNSIYFEQFLEDIQVNTFQISSLFDHEYDSYNKSHIIWVIFENYVIVKRSAKIY